MATKDKKHPDNPFCFLIQTNDWTPRNKMKRQMKYADITVWR